MIAIIDYDAGNVKSVTSALKRLNADYILTSNAEEIKKASKVLLPGVGSANVAMNDLKDKGLVDIIRKLRQPILGICVGLQLLCKYSEEGDTECMGLFDNIVSRFVPTKDSKVPHMGWNSITNLDSKLFKNVDERSHVYFVHSYYANLSTDTIAVSRHAGKIFSAALKYENFYGTQFHPEKSGSIGETILGNFLNL